MASPAQIAANRDNAQKSTGPTSPDGKKRASLNAWRHGLTAQTVILPQEDMAAYRALRQSFFDQFQPATALENETVGRLADNQWCLNRCAALENSVFALGHFESPGEVPACDSQIHASVTAVRVLRAQTDALKTLSLHEHRIHRMFQSDLAALHAMQAERKAQHRRQIHDAALIRKHKQTLDESWEPSQDGFLFSLAEIDRHITREAQRNAAVRTSLYGPPRAAGAPRAA